MPPLSLASKFDWVGQYIGIPFSMHECSHEGCNCWTLVALIYREQFNIELPTYSRLYENLTSKNNVELAEVIRTQYGDWTEVDKPLPGDAILLRIAGMNCHVGLVINRREMIHVLQGTHTTRERFDTTLWKHRVAGFYRHKERI